MGGHDGAAEPLDQIRQIFRRPGIGGEISFGSHVAHVEPGSVTSAFGTSCL